MVIMQCLRCCDNTLSLVLVDSHCSSTRSCSYFERDPHSSIVVLYQDLQEHSHAQACHFMSDVLSRGNQAEALDPRVEAVHCVRD
jgi:hypothetical protein